MAKYESQSAYVRAMPDSVDSTPRALIDASTRAYGATERRQVQFVTVTLLCIALIAALVGFSGVTGAAATPAKILFFLLLNASAVSFVVGIARRPPR